MIKNRKPRVSAYSLNYKCDRTECVFCNHVSAGIYCGHKERLVSTKEIKSCKDYKDRFS